MSAIAGNGPLPVPKTASILGRVKTARDIFAKTAKPKLQLIEDADLDISPGEAYTKALARAEKAGLKPEPSTFDMIKTHHDAAVAARAAKKPKTAEARDIFAKKADLDTQLSSKTPEQGQSRFTANKPQLETDKPSDVSMKTRETTETKPSTPAPDKLESAGKTVSEKVAGVWTKVFR
jgi:hypothetical protein